MTAAMRRSTVDLERENGCAAAEIRISGFGRERRGLLHGSPSAEGVYEYDNPRKRTVRRHGA